MTHTHATPARSFTGCLLTIVFLIAAAAADAQHQHPAPDARPGHMEHRFEDAEAYARRFDDPARDAWQQPERVIEVLRLHEGMSVADIGAGTGYFSVRLARHPSAPRVYAADIEPSMVDYLTARAAREQLPGIVPVHASADSSNLPAPVDLVLVVNTYHHIPNRVEYFSRLQRSLTASARVAIIDFRKESPEGPPVHVRFTPEQIAGELRQAGFELETTHDFLPRQHFLIFRTTPYGRGPSPHERD